MLRSILAVLLGGVLLAGCSAPAPPEPLILATTTSVGHSGLLEALLPAFERDTAIPVRAHLVGSGRSLAMLESGSADVAISHAPEREAELRRQHPSWLAEPFMANDFVVVGPPADPAGVAGSPTVREAMRRIASDSSEPFVSRGDSSGTHEREQRLWVEAGARPGHDRLIVSGQGMSATLRVASAMAAYTLTDRATFAQLQPAIDLRVVFSGSDGLRNVYVVYAPRDERGRPRRAEAETFARWLTERRAQQLIREYAIRGAPAFEPFQAAPPP